jgi:hypothetical protein
MSSRDAMGRTLRTVVARRKIERMSSWPRDRYPGRGGGLYTGRGGGLYTGPGGGAYTGPGGGLYTGPGGGLYTGAGGGLYTGRSANPFRSNWPPRDDFLAYLLEVGRRDVVDLLLGAGF